MTVDVPGVGGADCLPPPDRDGHGGLETVDIGFERPDPTGQDGAGDLGREPGKLAFEGGALVVQQAAISLRSAAAGSA